MKQEYIDLIKELEESNISADEVRELIKENKKIKEKYPNVKLRTISLPYLNSIKPTLVSTAMKITEENGELNRAIGKFRGMSGEKDGIKLPEQEAFGEITKELIDVVQTAFTMILILEFYYGIKVGTFLEQHIDKLVQKGYIDLEDDTIFRPGEEGMPYKVLEERAS